MRYRRKNLVREVAKSLRILLQEMRKFHLDWFVEVDHVYLSIVIPPKDVVVQMVTMLKSMTSAG